MVYCDYVGWIFPLCKISRRNLKDNKLVIVGSIMSCVETIRNVEYGGICCKKLVLSPIGRRSHLSLHPEGVGSSSTTSSHRRSINLVRCLHLHGLTWTPLPLCSLLIPFLLSKSLSFLFGFMQSMLLLLKFDSQFMVFLFFSFSFLLFLLFKLFFFLQSSYFCTRRSPF